LHHSPEQVLRAGIKALYETSVTLHRWHLVFQT
jgi:hypothetical protein